MRIYQCIHRYPPHIPLFEQRCGITDDMDFETVRRLLIEDGYASTYVLQPALEERHEEVFYTVWDYQRLQGLWAREHGLKTRDPVEIKLAQIEEFRPDVFYNMSAVYDQGFIGRLGKSARRKDVCWNAIIEATPRTFTEYDGHVSLHRPFVAYWRERGLPALELQPAIPGAWSALQCPGKTIEVLFYGQYTPGGLLDNRNRLSERLLHHAQESGSDIRCHLSYTERRRTLFRIPGISGWRIPSPIISFPRRFVREHALPPLYGRSLYEALAQAKVVINAYGDYNRSFKSNMRLFEAVGCGAFLVSEAGDYPDGFEPDVDFLTYRNFDELVEQVERILADWPVYAEAAARTQKKIASLYGKERQWNDFLEFAKRL